MTIMTQIFSVCHMNDGLILSIVIRSKERIWLVLPLLLSFRMYIERRLLEPLGSILLSRLVRNLLDLGLQTLEGLIFLRASIIQSRALLI